MSSPVYAQEDHRWVADDGGVNGGTLLGSGNNEDRSQDVDTTIRLRIVTQETNNKAANNIIFQARALKNGTGSWGTDDFQITSSSTGLQLTDDSQSIADHATTTQRIGNGTYTSGDSQGWNDGTTDDLTGNIDFVGNDEAEIELCLTLPSGSNSNGDYYEIRIYESAGTALTTYPGTLPKLTAVAAVIEPLTAAITAAGDITTANITKTRSFTAAIAAAGDAAANLLRTRSIIAAITAAGDITTANLDYAAVTEPLTADITADGDITTANLATTFRYWVGDTDGNWNNSNNWALTSGGTGGAGVPTSTSKVRFDNQYTTANCTVNVATAYAKSITFVNGGNYNGTLNANGNNVNIGTGGLDCTGGGSATLTMGSGTWTCSGHFDFQDIGTINGGTLEMTGAANLVGKGTGALNGLSSITVKTGGQSTVTASTRSTTWVVESGAQLTPNAETNVNTGSITNNGTVNAGTGFIRTYASTVTNNNSWNALLDLWYNATVSGVFGGDVKFYDYTINATITIAAAGVTVAGNAEFRTAIVSPFTIDNSAGGTVTFQGDVVKHATFNDTVTWSKGGAISLDGTSSTDFDGSIFDSELDPITYDKTAGGTTLTGNLATQGLDYGSGSAGAFSAGGYDVDLGTDGLDCTNGGSATLTMGSGKWTCYGDWDTRSIGTFNRDTAELDMAGTSKTLYNEYDERVNTLTISGTITAGGSDCYAQAGVTVSGTFTSAITVSTWGGFSVSGTWNLNAGNCTAQGTSDFTGGTITGSGTLILKASFSGTPTLLDVSTFNVNAENSNITVPGITFGSAETILTITAGVTRSITFTGSPTFQGNFTAQSTTTGNLTVVTGSNTLTLQGDFDTADTGGGSLTWNETGGSVDFTGTSNQTFTDAAGVGSIGNVDVNKTGRLTLASNMGADSFTLTDGDLDVAGYTVTCEGAINLDGGTGGGRLWNGVDEDMANGKFVIGNGGLSAGTVDGDSGAQLVIDNLDFQLVNSSTLTATYCDIGTSDVTGGTGDATDATNTDLTGNSGWNFSTIEPLTAAITATGDVAATLTYTAALTAAITATGDVAASLTRTIHFDAGITATGDITTANLDVSGGTKQLEAAITASGDVAANIGTTDRYWVGDTDGTWGDATNWAYSSGGTGEAGIPTATSDVYFDDQYTTANCTIDVATAYAKSITFVSGGNYNGTLNANSNNVNIGSGGLDCTGGGSATLTRGSGTWTCSGNMSFVGIGTIDSNASHIRMTGSSTTLNFGDTKCSSLTIVSGTTNVSLQGNGYRGVNGGTVIESGASAIVNSSGIYISDGGGNVINGTLTLNQNANFDGTTTVNVGGIINGTGTMLGTNTTVDIMDGTWSVNINVHIPSYPCLWAAATYGGATNIFYNSTASTGVGPRFASGTTIFTGDVEFRNSGTGELVVDLATNDASVVFQGDLYLNEQTGTLTWNEASTGTVSFTGSNNQTFTDAAGVGSLGDVDVNKTAGRLTLAAGMGCDSFTLTDGDLDLAGYTITSEGAIDLDGGTGGGGRLWNGVDEDQSNGKFIIGNGGLSAGTIDGDAGGQLVIDNLDFQLANSSTLTATYCDIGTSDVTGGTGDATDATNTNQDSNTGWDFGGVTEPLTAVITTSGDLAATLTYTAALTAAITATGDVVASLTRTIHFDAGITATGDITTADLAVGGEKALTSDITAGGDLAATLTYTAALTAAITATGDVVASLTRTIHFDAGIIAEGDLAATLTYTAALTAAITATGDVATSLTRTIHFTAGIAATGDITTADLEVGGEKALTSDIVAEGDLAATLTYTAALTAAITATGDVAASLTRTIHFDAGITATGDITTADLDKSAAKALTADITAEGDLAANLTRTRSFGGDITADGDILANIMYTAALTAMLTGDGSLSGDLLAKVPLSVSIDGTGLLNANLIRIRTLTSTIECTGDLLGQCIVQRNFVASITAEADVDANLSVQLAIGNWFYRSGTVNRLLV